MTSFDPESGAVLEPDTQAAAPAACRFCRIAIVARQPIEGLTVSNAVRAGAGLHFATTVDRVTAGDLPPGPLYVLDPEGRDIRSVTVPDDALLAFGSERHGVSEELRARATELVAIPMRPQVSSFNLATSVGMALFHWASSGPRPAA